MALTKQALLLKRLKKVYGAPETELNYGTPFELLVSVMLSAQSTDKKVNEITPALFAKYPSPTGLSKAEVGEVEKLIRQVNYHKTKARHLIQTSDILVNTHGGNVPSTHEDLIALPGVGNKTANVVMSELGYGYALPVDTHVFRVSHRLGLVKSKNVEGVERELCEQFPKERWHELHHWLIFHGRRVCDARKPKCDGCVLSDLCSYYTSLES